ncbi:MAG: hypothetical protein COA78_18390 [Blastopirellula sp.]|nr:MAG: hypothetical protein COA78_18390 [Blastopirellula sp.]
MNKETLQQNHTESTQVSRRQFLEAAGFSVSLAVLSGCGRAPIQTALPFAEQPVGVIPGVMRSYASTCIGCSAGCGMLVGVRDGRPLKMEGMPEHPISGGGLCAIGQALPLGLYDNHRLKQPLKDGEPADWESVDKAITEQLASNGSAVRLVTSTVTSPTLQATIDQFLNQFTDARHIIFDSVSSSAILDAHEKTHGTRLLPHYDLNHAEVIVSFGADFLGTWISPIEFAKAWSSRRVPTEENPTMSYHVQLEGRVSLTGCNADRRYRLSPDEYGIVLSHLAVEISKLAGKTPPEGNLAASPISAEELSDLSHRLWHAHGASLVISDSQDFEVQLLVNHINHTLGNYTHTIDIERPSYQCQGNDAEVVKLIEELKSGSVSALLVAGTDFTHNLPDHDSLTSAISNVPLVISFAQREDDFASLAHFVCPDHHALESCGDAEPISGRVSLLQPTLAPLGNTRSVLESLSLWSGNQSSAYEILQASWKENILPRVQSEVKSKSFVHSWDIAVQQGFVELETEANSVGEFQPTAVKLVTKQPVEDEFVLTLYSKTGLTDSSHAHNPWLQELPDPVTKITWDNYVCISPTAAKELGVSDGDVIRVETKDGPSEIELPALIQRGQHDRVISIALGYGVRGTDRFANIGPQWLEGRPTVAAGELVGKNAASMIDINGGLFQYSRAGISLHAVKENRPLAATQEYHSLELPKHIAPPGAEIRDAVQTTTLAEYKANPEAGAPHMHHFSDKQLWAEDHTTSGPLWGMSIDLNKCTGCSACLIACQSENNVPVVGKDEVYRQREMHWLRIDRYFMGEDDDMEVLHQPMMCQHCGNAPCETVCPALATVHSEEGLNEQVYNRCVGTRYCANNCPYKVRRFNWFTYPQDDLQTLALNPDVTVRTRGVMEKCSMCVQRIEDGKIAASHSGIPLADGDIQIACQQSCPTQAIVFGDMNDQSSEVLKALHKPRNFKVLDEFNFRPSVGYLRVVKNRDDNHHEGGTHE